MKLAGKRALGHRKTAIAASAWALPAFSPSLTARKVQFLRVAINKHWMKRSPSWDPKAHGFRADVTVAEVRKMLCAELAKDFGKLDIVFANAGISGRTPTGATDEAIFQGR